MSCGHLLVKMIYLKTKFLFMTTTIVIICGLISIIHWIKWMISETSLLKAITTLEKIHADIDCLHLIIEDANKNGFARNFKSDNTLLMKFYQEWLEYFLKYQLDLKINALKKKVS